MATDFHFSSQNIYQCLPLQIVGKLPPVLPFISGFSTVRVLRLFEGIGFGISTSMSGTDTMNS